MKITKKIANFCLLMVFIANALCSSVLAEELTFEKGNVLFQYNAATASKDWKIFSRGKWTFAEDGISVENNDNRTGDDAWYYAYHGAKNGWKNYVIECDMENVTECAILFRITDPTDKSVDAFGGYSCGYDSTFTFMGKDNNDKWLTLADGGEDASAEYKCGYTPNMHWALYVQGNTFTLYIDNAKFATMQCVDKENTYTSGGIGVRFRTYVGDYSGKIKNLKVSELKAKSNTNSDSKDTKSKVGTTKSNTEATQSAVDKNNSNTQSAVLGNDELNTESDSNTAVEGLDSQEQIVDDTGSVVEVNTIKTEIPAWIIVIICVLGVIMAAIPIVFIIFICIDKKRTSNLNT